MNKFPISLNIEVSPENISQVIDSVRSFLSLIAKPGSKQLGLLLEDQIRSQRVLSQVRILLKVKKYVEERGISINAIPMKILVPLLDHGSLEEDDDLQELWAKMLANMLDSEESFQNHVFPYILSQFSIDDYTALCLLLASEKSIVQSEEMLEKLETDGFIILAPTCDNLLRLGLIRLLPPKIEFLGHDRPEGYQLQLKYHTDKRSYRMTELGFQFCKCIELTKKS